MNKQPISLQDFIDALQIIVDQSIWRVIHPADGWLTIDLGKKYIDTVPSKGGKDEPYEKGQYQLHITGDWKVYRNEKLVESRNVSDDDQKSYFDRMEKLVSNFPIRKIKSVNLNQDELIIEGEESDIRIPVSDTADSLSLTAVELDNNNKPVSYTHCRFDEELERLVRISTT